MRTDGRTDTNSITKLLFAFRSFWNALKTRQAQSINRPFFISAAQVLSEPVVFKPTDIRQALCVTLCITLRIIYLTVQYI